MARVRESNPEMFALADLDSVSLKPVNKLEFMSEAEARNHFRNQNKTDAEIDGFIEEARKNER